MKFRHFQRHLRTAAVVLCLGGMPLAGTAAVEPLQEARTLLEGGQLPQALEKANQHLAAKPQDAQGRFVKGVILTRMNRDDEAAAVFQALTEDHPELPEPYNNLGVIYAQQGQYDKARAALEMAIRTRPDYATAYENLGDIYARLASRAYGKALQIEAGNATARSKLALIRELMSLSAGPAAAQPPSSRLARRAGR